jgi:hypothetical protein
VNKGTGSTSEYKLTRFGHLLALLIETDFDDSKKSYNSLYSFLESYFNDGPYSLDCFCKIYLNKCKERDLFKAFIDYLRKNIIYENRYIENENDLFIHMVLSTTNDTRLNRRLWKLWDKSFKELKREIQTLFSYHLKLKIDGIIDETVSDYGHYEDVLYRQHGRFDTVVIEYRCLKCDSDFCFYSPINILDYLRSLFQGVKIKKLLIQRER